MERSMSSSSLKQGLGTGAKWWGCAWFRRGERGARGDSATPAGGKWGPVCWRQGLCSGAWCGGSDGSRTGTGGACLGECRGQPVGPQADVTSYRRGPSNAESGTSVSGTAYSWL